MKMQADKPSYFDRAEMARGALALLVTGLVAILFSTAVLARMMGWGPNSIAASGDMLALDQLDPAPATSEVRAGPRCPECGVIVSVREIERQNEDSDPGAAGAVTAVNGNGMRAKAARRYKIIVRMADGSSRAIDDANPARWRPGERLIVIAGAGPSPQ